MERSYRVKTPSWVQIHSFERLFFRKDCYSYAILFNGINIRFAVIVKYICACSLNRQNILSAARLLINARCLIKRNMHLLAEVMLENLRSSICCATRSDWQKFLLRQEKHNWSIILLLIMNGIWLICRVMVLQKWAKAAEEDGNKWLKIICEKEKTLHWFLFW